MPTIVCETNNLFMKIVVDYFSEHRHLVQLNFLTDCNLLAAGIRDDKNIALYIIKSHQPESLFPIP